MTFHGIFSVFFWFAEVPYDKITDCDVQETDTQQILGFFGRYPKHSQASDVPGAGDRS